MKASDLKGRAIVTVADATKIGQVDDILFDRDYRRVVGLGVKSGLFSRPEVVSREHITAVGADAVTIPGADVVNTPDRIAELDGAATLNTVRGTKVVTEGGTLLGTIGELELDNEARTVTAYLLDAPLLDRLRGHIPSFTADQVISLGASGIMVVANGVAEAVGKGPSSPSS